jgi:hypothetical protein
MGLKYHYIIDTKLFAYSELQTGNTIENVYNSIARILINYPKGNLYFVFDKGKSEHRLKVSLLYKGNRKKAKDKYDEHQKAVELQFQEDYLALIELSKLLPIKVIAVDNVEADDLASILAFDLAKDKSNRIGLLTNDRDWLASTIDDKNVKLILQRSSKEGFAELDSNYTKDEYNVRSREEFTLKKALEGDSGDNLLTHSQLGQVRANKVWQTIIDSYEEPTLEDVRRELILYRKSERRVKPNPAYREIGSYNSKQMLNINYHLAETLTTPDQLEPYQQTQYSEQLTADVPIDAHPDFIAKSMIVLGVAMHLSTHAKRVFRVHT